MNWIAYILAAGAGAANPAQAGANAELGKSLHDPLWACIWVYLSGLLGMLVILAIVREALPGSAKLAHTPWWAWLGGLLSIASTLSGLVFAQKMGSGVFTGLSVTASLVTSIVLDNFGWVGFKIHPASPMRILGTVLMIVGLWLITRF